MYPIQASQIKHLPIQHFTLWDGERGVMVMMHVGMHGFPDAVIVTREPDGPMTVVQWNKDYALEFDREGEFEDRFRQRVQLMKEWVAAQLNEMATGKPNPRLVELGIECGEVRNCDIVRGDKFLFA